MLVVVQVVAVWVVAVVVVLVPFVAVVFALLEEWGGVARSSWAAPGGLGSIAEVAIVTPVA